MDDGFEITRLDAVRLRLLEAWCEQPDGALDVLHF